MRFSSSPFAHIGDAAGLTGIQLVACGLVVLFVALLVVEHTKVKHGYVASRFLVKPLAAVVTVALAAVVAPATGIAQSPIGPMGLPDLISDPPFIWIERDLHNVDDEIIHVLAFDGFLHNIGEGALEVAGNPQIEGDVTQRVFDGETWSDVATPDVRYETDDGHNHFHLMNAAEYTLWDEAQSEQVGVGAKVGFCLLDTRQIERGVDAEYNIADIDYCNVDEPDSTDLRMGISPGWVDIYEASITFQWVDVSNTTPGRYFVGAQVDPENQIVESNEDNNDVVFSSNKYAVSGYVARPLPTQTSSSILLKSLVYGTVGQVAYVITDAPQHGTLSVPIGVDVLDPAITYVPDDGYEGLDQFSYYAHDTNSAFPFDAEVVTVDIDVSTDMQTAVEPSPAAAGVTITPESAAVSASRYERISLPVDLAGQSADANVSWYAKNLPPGLTIDPSSGRIEGELTYAGSITSVIVARVDGTDVEETIDWSIEDRDRVSLRALNDFSTVLERRDILVGAGTGETQYEATGLPDGVVLTEGQPSILGVPTETGAFEIVVNELRDGEVVDTVSFTMTVRPSIRPAFPL